MLCLSLSAMRRRRGIRFAMTVVTLIVAMVAMPVQPALACGGTPPPPFCGASIVLVKAVPDVVVIPPGGDPFEVVVPTLVFFQLFGGACPDPPYFVDIDIDVICTDLGGAPAPGGSGSFMGPIAPGFNFIGVPVTIDPGPARLCTVVGTASTTLILPVGPQPSGGPPITASVTISDMGDTVMCLVDPLPGTTDTPRLDMTLIEPVSGEIQCAHPGDQVGFMYTITNNDPLEKFEGDLSVVSRNSSRLPMTSGEDLTSAGGGVVAISDTGDGDDFPIAFRDGLDILGCVPLPVDPILSVSPEITTTISLDPLESVDVEIFARSWGMCANGSCGEGTVTLRGEFSDTTEGFACAGFALAADTSKPSSYQWPDAGHVWVVTPLFSLPDSHFEIQGLPFTGVEQTLDYRVSNLVATQNGTPLPSGFEFFGLTEDGSDRGRHQVQWFNPDGLLTPGATIQIDYDAQITPSLGSSITAITENMIQLVPNAPEGFENTGPFAVGGFAAQNGINAYHQYMTQFSGRFSQLNGNETIHPIVWDSISVTPLPFVPNTAGFHVSATTTVPNIVGDPFVLMEIYEDVRGFAMPWVPLENPNQLIDVLLGMPMLPTPPLSTLDLNDDGRIDAADLVRWLAR